MFPKYFRTIFRRYGKNERDLVSASSKPKKSTEMLMKTYKGDVAFLMFLMHNVDEETSSSPLTDRDGLIHISVRQESMD